MDAQMVTTIFTALAAFAALGTAILRLFSKLECHANPSALMLCCA
jgi:hypothetical protein